MTVFVWSIYNGATYYIDVFGKRFQKELEDLRKDVARWQTSPDMTGSPDSMPKGEGSLTPQPQPSSMAAAAGIDKIPLLDPKTGTSSGSDGGSGDLRERKGQ